MKKITFLLFPLIGIILLTACAGDTATPIPPPPTLLPTSEVSALEQSATAEAINSEPTAAVLPTETLPPPTIVPTPEPPPTIAPLPTSTIEGALEEEGGGLITAEDFGSDRNPLTGELVDDPANLQRRPIAIKLSNAPAKYTRPQSGLNEADLVYEHTTEGNLTRFTAIFFGNTPPRVGPIRSARLIDLELPAMYHAALAYSGSSHGVGELLKNADFRPRIIYAYDKGFYRTGEEDKPIEHTLYATPELLWEGLTEKEQNEPVTFPSSNVFNNDPPPGGTPASGISIDHNWTLVNWRYNGETGRYERWADGIKHLDGNTLEQVNAANVIVLSPYHAFDGEICEQYNAEGECAAYSVEIQIWGSGNAAIYRDGQKYNVIWHRDGRNDPLTFTDQAGNPFPLKIGNSWVQLVPTWLKNPVTITP